MEITEFPGGLSNTSLERYVCIFLVSIQEWVVYASTELQQEWFIVHGHDQLRIAYR